ncbi:MAG: hypothetical protein NVSMB22_18620 [Chloroflexota bacterium]
MPVGEMLTVGDVARKLRVAEETVRTWLRTDRMHGYNFGGRTGWRVSAAELDRFVENHAGRGATET